MERIKILDGIYLNFIENSKFKTNYMNLVFLSDLNDNIASFDTLLSRVLVRGTKKYPTQLLLNRALDDSYDLELSSDVMKIGEKHALEIAECFLDDSYSLDDESISQKAIDFLNEVIFAPLVKNGAFDSEIVESEKKFAVDEIDAQINNKAKYSVKEMIAYMCRSEKYATNAIGKKSIIKKITPAELYGYYKDLIKHANIEVFCVGRFDSNTVKNRICEMFSSVERENVVLEKAVVKNKVVKIKEKCDFMDIMQSNLALGFRTGIVLTDDDFYALMLYNSVLGGCLTSKLFTVIREKMSLCYSIFSQLDPLKGIMLVYAGIGADKKDVTVEEIKNQMKLIETGKVSPEELESARGYIINSLRGLSDNPASLPDWFLTRVTENSNLTPETVIEGISKVTLCDVVRVSKKIKLDTVYFLTGKGE